MGDLQKSHRELYDAIVKLTNEVDSHLFHLESEALELARYPALQLAGNAINDRAKRLTDMMNGLKPIMQRAKETAMQESRR